jgi:hypothetical protein
MDEREGMSALIDAAVIVQRLRDELDQARAAVDELVEALEELVEAGDEGPMLRRWAEAQSDARIKIARYREASDE